MTVAERAGFAPDRLARIDRVIREKYVESGSTAGTVIKVWRRGELVHTGIAGMMDLEGAKPMREDAIFRIYSMTKPVTAVALLVLLEDGTIDLDDEVSKFIPAWKDLQVFEGGTRGAFRTRPPKRPMRIIDLATHTSGLTYDWMGMSEVDAAYLAANFNRRDFEGGLDGLVEILGTMPLEFSPGDHWNYSLSMDVLASIVQSVSGLRYSEFLRTRIFEPLGMHDTSYFCPPDKTGRLTTAYEWRDGKLSRDDRRTNLYKAAPKLEEGGAGLASTADDYMRFCRMLLGGGALDGVRVLSPKSVALFSENLLGRTIGEASIPGRNGTWMMGGDGFSICCGVTLDMGHKHALGSPGDFYWSGAQMTQFWVDPAEDLAVVFMTQVSGSPHHFTIPRVLRALVYGAMTESRA
jgi:CubicO group peptidase (beta-lactamase class C family)